MSEQELDPNIVFLSSSQNNILVCTILKGVNLALDTETQFEAERASEIAEVKEIKSHSFQEVEVIDPILFQSFKMQKLGCFYQQEKERNS